MTVWLCRQIIEGTVLDDLTLVYDNDSVAFLNRGHPMCNDNGSAPFHGTIEGLLYDLLALLVESRRCLIEDQDAWIFNECTSDRNSLLLSTGQLRALEPAYLLEARMQLLF